jgi:hypothetical protein
MKDLDDDLREELLFQSPIEYRCPHLRRDRKGCYCGMDLKIGGDISDERRRICDNASLQLWCLDKDRYSLCIWYRGEPFTE